MPVEHLSWTDSIRQIVGLAVLAATVALWLRATRSLRRGTVIDRLLDGFVLLSWLAIVVFWVLAAPGWFQPFPALVLLGGGGGVAAWLTRHVPAPSAKPEPFVDWGQHRLLLAVMAAPWAILGTLRFLKALVAPPLAWDTLTYHLPKAAMWVQTGGLTLPGFPDAWSYYVWFPAGSDILLSWLLLSTRSDLLIGPFGPLVWLLALLAVRRFVGLTGASTEVAWLTAVAIATLPCVFAFSTSAYADVPLLLMGLLAVTYTVEFLRGSQPLAAAYAAATAGLAAAIKFSGLVMLAAILAALAWKLLFQYRRRRAMLAATVLLLAFLPTLGYLRAWLVEGSPFYPGRSPIVSSAPFHEGFDLILSGSGLDEHQTHVGGVQNLVALFWPRRTIGDHLNFGTGGLVLVLLATAGLGRSIARRSSLGLALLSLALACSTLPALFGSGVAALRTVWLDVIGRLLVPGWAPALAFASVAPQAVVLPGLVIASVLNLAHALPLGLSPAIVAASLSAGAAMIAAALAAMTVAAFARRGRWHSSFIAPLLVASLVLVPSVSVIRKRARFDIWHQTGQGGPAFDGHALNPVFNSLVPILEQLDDGLPKQLAVTAGWDGTGHNQFLYPLMGRRLENRLLYVPVTRFGDDADLLPDARWQQRDKARWLARLEAADVGYLIGLWPRPPEWEWVEEHPERFEVLDLDPSGFYRLARVR